MQEVNNKIKKAVAYCRFSSINQREESITAQHRAIKKYCEENNIELLRVYTDEACSAKTDNRPSFLQMIKDSDTRMFDYVIVHKLDRFARNRYDSAVNKMKLKKNGVRVLSVLEKLDDSPEAIIMESFYEGYAEYYSANLSREVKKGMKENAYQSKFNGGTIPYGYNISEDGHYVINPQEADIIKYVYDMYMNGNSLRVIANDLNNKGYRTKRGNKFTSKSFSTMLKNDLYTGTYSYNFNDEKIKIKGGVPAILTEQQFQKLQKLKSSRSKIMNVKSDYNYLVSGLLYHKGMEMIGTAGTSKTGKVYNYYKTKRGKKYYRADKIDEAIASLVKDVLFFDKNIETLIDMIYEGINNVKENEQLLIHEKKIKAIDKKIDNIVSAIMDGFRSEKMKKELSSLEEQKESLEVEIIKLRSVKKTTKEEIKEFMNSYKNRLDNGNDLKIITHHLIQKIDLSENGALSVELKNVKSSYKDLMVGHQGLEPGT